MSETHILNNQSNDESIKVFEIQKKLKVIFDITKITHKTEILKRRH